MTITTKLKTIAAAGLSALSIFASGCACTMSAFSPREMNAIEDAVEAYKQDMGNEAFLALNGNKDAIKILSQSAMSPKGKVGPWLKDREILEDAEKAEKEGKYFAIIFAPNGSLFVELEESKEAAK